MSDATYEPQLKSMRDCINCTHSEYRDFNQWGSNKGLYCKYAKMRIKNNIGLKCFKFNKETP